SAFSDMICRSLRTVVYPAARAGPRLSCTSRTVLGPRSQRTRRISSSPGVGRGGEVMPRSLVRRLSSCQRNLSYNCLDALSSGSPPDTADDDRNARKAVFAADLGRAAHRIRRLSAG